MVTEGNRSSRGLSTARNPRGSYHLPVPSESPVMPHTVRPTPDKLFDVAKAKAALKAAGKSYADVGRALGLERQAVGHWFRDRGEPTMRQLKGMADAIGVHWLELVDEETLVVWKEEERRRVERMRALSDEEKAKLDAWLELNTGTKEKT